MSNEYELTLTDYIYILRRRIKLLAAIFSGVLLIAIVTAFVLPPTYRATGTILVESQELSDTIIPATTIRSHLDEQISSIKLRILTRENLQVLANKYNLFNDLKGKPPSSEMIDNLRNRVIIDTEGPNSVVRTNRLGQQTTAFMLSFEDQKPEIAFNVTRDLMTQFIDWNSKLRTEGATETTEFLTQESDKLKSELDKQEQLISEFKLKNRNALPEQLTLRMTMLSRAENDMHEVERDIRSINEELRALDVELTATRRAAPDASQTDSLPALQAELTRLSAIYKENHPDIQRLKRRIKAMESSPGGEEGPLNVEAYRIKSKIESDKVRLSSLYEQKKGLQQKIQENENAMILTPKVEQGLEVLVRDRDIAKKKFEEFRSKRMNAKIAENLESENKSGSFSVLEPPVMPAKPFKPNRIKFVIGGFFLALFAAGGLVMLLETADKRIRGVAALTHAIGQRPLAVIPILNSPEEGVKRRISFKNLTGSLIGGIFLTGIALASLHFTTNI